MKLVNLLLITSAYDVQVIFAALAFVTSIVQENGKGYRVWMLANVGIWCIYDFIKPAYGPLITHSVQLAFTICSIFVYDKEKLKWRK